MQPTSEETIQPPLRRTVHKSTFRTQAKALLRKNLLQQRRAICTNVCIIITPVFFCLLLFVLQLVIDNAIDTPDNRCGCLCLTCCDTNSTTGEKVCRTPTDADPCQGWETCEVADETKCGFQYSNAGQVGFCAIPTPSIWPAMVSVPSEGYLAHPYSPNTEILMTGEDPSLAQDWTLFPNPNATAADTQAAATFFAQGQETNAVYAAALSFLGITLGSFKKFDFWSYYIEPGFLATDSYNASLNLMSTDATAPTTIATNDLLTSFFTSNVASTAINISVTPLGTDQVWKSSADDVNRQLYCGYKDARCNGTSEINAITAAYDFGATSAAKGVFSMRMWYNATHRYGDGGQQPTQVVRVHAAMNAAVNAFLKSALNSKNVALSRLIGVMEMPKAANSLTLDISSLVGTLFYTWLLQLLLPVMLSTLVTEKEQRLRTMMKMHGLGDAAYFTIQYMWFFVVNMIYVWILIGAGSAINLAFFTLTSYSFQFVFYALWVLCLLSFTFLLASIFRSARTAVVCAFMYVFATGLIGYLLLQSFVASGQWWAIFFNIVPGFALYRGLFEISQYAFRAAYQGTEGMTWSKLSDDGNGLPAVMAFFVGEAIIFLVLAWYFEKVLPGGVGVPQHPLFFLGKKYKSDLNTGGGGGGGGGGIEVEKKEGGDDLYINGGEATVAVSVEPEDVAAERQRVVEYIQTSNTTTTTTTTMSGISSHFSSSTIPPPAILVQHLRKVFPGKLKKVAVQDLALIVAQGEVFGLLGPNGAGKSTTLNILTGFLTPNSGTALVQGHDIRSDMNEIYGLMGVCPQDNLLWDRLTAKEHVSFYGRLKGLVGRELDAAVEAGLRSVNLWNGGVADKQVRTFSGGMKRRLSVAISLIGDPQVVYLDEPSTGLDPSSRQNLWSVVKAARAGRGIILTTHSMEEAAALCDRLGIFVDGQLVCIGAPKELTARYGGYLVFTGTTVPGGESSLDALVRRISPSARLTYAVGCTLKFELPTSEVSLASVFDKMEKAVKDEEVVVLDWGVTNATLEEVFIKFAKSIGAEGGN